MNTSTKHFKHECFKEWELLKSRMEKVKSGKQKKGKFVAMYILFEDKCKKIKSCKRKYLHT
jgi:hypothetical protein